MARFKGLMPSLLRKSRKTRPPSENFDDNDNVFSDGEEDNRQRRDRDSEEPVTRRPTGTTLRKNGNHDAPTPPRGRNSESTTTSSKTSLSSTGVSSHTRSRNSRSTSTSSSSNSATSTSRPKSRRRSSRRRSTDMLRRASCQWCGPSRGRAQRRPNLKAVTCGSGHRQTRSDQGAESGCLAGGVVHC